MTKSELFELGGIGFITTACFSVGINYINRGYDIGKDLEFTKDIPNELRIRWTTKGEQDYVFGSILLVVGVIAFLAGGAKIWQIIRSTDHS